MQIPTNLNLLYIQQDIRNCRLCPRLIEYIHSVGMSKQSKFSQDDYWSRPVPSFGDSKASLLVVGLAPAAHGGNRTGRMFTGDSSGDWLMRAMFETGFANIPNSVSINDGLVLKNAYVTSVVKCAPPNNKPTYNEILNCATHLKKELSVLKGTLKVIVTLGKIALDSYCNLTNNRGLKFRHGGIYSDGDERVLIVSYHPSKRNTNTGLLTWPMWIKIFKKAKSIIDNNPNQV